ncbi:hypothetical protein [Methylobacterium gregans]|uniref:Uncharacterized protein n=1 Tax=Methylobacterium gregans TaxID=374424 RepID=A0AA37MAF9_9HYPH|nr:hypothetical protein [Methylobacterium gregans]MDQ0523244.1 hypothetical protein [Methylobacterium gregans]GJD78810.1 hypothetical protein NBEOAGPD_2029 [Methylobacterium gregans]GLS53537.1 hypothetical protein GCM10007886_17200 [Methylobacterium gregans]
MEPTPSSAIAEIDRFIEESRQLIARAEACRQSLIALGAREGHLLMATRTITAMGRIQATLLRQRAMLPQRALLPEGAAPPEAGRVPAVVVVARPARPWWALVGRRKAEARLS